MNLAIDRAEFSKKLMSWWRENKRDFPWRKTGDPYKMLISEVMLHRTRANQVTPVYLKFLKAFPNIVDLSKAREETVRDLLHPLGLNWRAELLLHMASEIMRKHNGKIPFEKEKLESLPGVGRYISSAVRCFAFGYSETLLDTNTVRILGRVYGIAINDSSRRSKSFEKLYESLIDVRHPENFNYAMIDLGAVICKPKNPSCHICPLNTVCAFAHQRL